MFPRPRVVLVSGPVSAGKTTLCDTLCDRFPGFRLVKTRDILTELTTGRLRDRRALQSAGDALDRRTHGRWIADYLVRYRSDSGDCYVVDAVRIKSQIDAIRQAFGPRAIHVHLTAPDDVLAKRYSTRSTSGIRELKTYAELRRNETERKVERLRAVADVVINTERSSAEDVLVRVASRLGLYGRGLEKLVDVLVGGQYGSEGKGHVAAYLAPEYSVLVRVGGPNAGHKVYEEGAPLTFHHLPSGTTRAPAAQIVLGPGAVLYVPKLLEEIAAAELAFDRLSIDPNAMTIDEDDRASESTLRASIGSTAQGVGYATARKILRTAAEPKVVRAEAVPDLRPYIRSTAGVLQGAFARGERVFLEGTQGTALSLHHGDFPYVTSRDTTVSGCLADAGIAPSRVRRIVMVCRTYPIRVESPAESTSGPMGIELSWKEISARSGIAVSELEDNERTSTTGRRRRVAEFDWALLRKAAFLNGATDIALSFADYLSVENRSARRFEQLRPDTIRFIEEVETVAAAPVTLITTRFHYRSIIDRRSW